MTKALTRWWNAFTRVLTSFPVTVLDWSRNNFVPAAILFLFAAIPASVAQLSVEAPKDRYVHVEAFRYGKDPAVIRCNRGDTLHLTFSTRDTGHSFFLEEFDIDAKITPASRSVAVFRPSDPEPTPSFQQEVTFRAEHPGWRRFLASKSLYRCHVWCGPMHAFEHGKLIIYPNTLLWAGLGLVAGIPLVGGWGLKNSLRASDTQPLQVSPTDGWDVFHHLPWLKRFLRIREFTVAAIVVTSAGLYFVLLTTLFGTKVAGRNFGVMMMWVVWMFLLTVVLTPLGGRVWCLVCPLPILGDVVQRRALVGVRRGSTKGYNNRFFGWNLPWPKPLANDWPRLFSFLIFGTFSSALVAYPKFTGWAILGLVLLAALMAPIWELRSFCRYLCPVTGFLNLYSKTSKLALRATDLDVCARCRVRTCLLGSAKGWACPFGLCAADIRENNDCGMCGECLRTCAYDNVTIRWRPFAREIQVRSAGEAWLAMSMFVLATAYCIVHLGHWSGLRDYVNILDKANYGLFAVFAFVLWLFALGIVPGTMLALAAVGKRLAGLSVSAFATMKASTTALIPSGLSVWMAFVVPMLTVNVTFVLQSFSDPFGWGWNLLGEASTPWHQLWPSAVPWIQVSVILAGLGYSLRNAWRAWFELTLEPRAALRGMLPLAGFLVLYTGGMVWFFAN